MIECHEDTLEYLWVVFFVKASMSAFHHFPFCTLNQFSFYTFGERKIRMILHGPYCHLFTSIINFSCLHIIVFCLKKPFYCWFCWFFHLPCLFLPFEFKRLILVYLALLLEFFLTAMKLFVLADKSHHAEHVRISTYSLLVLEMKDTFLMGSEWKKTTTCFSTSSSCNVYQVCFL